MRVVTIDSSKKRSLPEYFIGGMCAVSYNNKMSPTILRKNNFRYFFNSREETRMHVHVATPDGTAKFWLEPIVALADYYNLSSKDLKEILETVEEKKDEFITSWQKHFLQ